MTNLINVVKTSWKSLLRSPAYTLAAVAILGLGIAGTAIMFGVLKAVVLNPLPYPEHQRLLSISESKLPDFPQFAVASGKFVLWEQETTTFESMTMLTGAALTLTGRAEPVRLRAVISTERLFDTLGVPMQLGRGFGAADRDPSARPVVLSDATWRAHFAASESVLGSSIMLDGEPYTVIGVAARGLNFPSRRSEIYTLLRLSPELVQNYGAHNMGVIGRLKDGATIDGALAEMNTIAERLEREFPAQNTGWRVVASTLAEARLGGTESRLYLLFAGVGLLLLIACANVASLTLVRATGRVHEFAVRRAHGASNARVALQTAIEGMLLGGMAALFGAFLAGILLPVIRAIAPAQTPRIDEAQFDPMVALVATVVSLFAGLLAAVVPAWLASRRSVAHDLRSGGRGALGGAGAYGRAGLVAIEVALAVVLLAGAGLLARSLMSVSAVDPGFSTASNQFTRIELPPSRYSDSEASTNLYRQLVERVAAIPGVNRVGVAQTLPLIDDYVISFEVQGQPPADPDELQAAIYYAADAGFMRALGLRILRGRGIDERDRAGSARVVAVSESFAAKYFPGADAIGQRVRLGVGGDDWREIVGIVTDVRHYGLETEARVQAYEPFAHSPFSRAYLVIDTALSPAAATAALRGVMRQLDGDLPVDEFRSLDNELESTLAGRRFTAGLIVAFALSALLLAATGLYSSLAFLVGQNSREIGVRLALGASRQNVMQMVLRRGVLLGALGAGIGVVLSLLNAQLIEGMVFGVSARDPVTLGLIAFGMLVVAVLASAIPAMRAMRIDPITVLRGE